MTSSFLISTLGTDARHAAAVDVGRVEIEFLHAHDHAMQNAVASTAPGRHRSLPERALVVDVPHQRMGPSVQQEGLQHMVPQAGRRSRIARHLRAARPAQGAAAGSWPRANAHRRRSWQWAAGPRCARWSATPRRPTGSGWRHGHKPRSPPRTTWSRSRSSGAKSNQKRKCPHPNLWGHWGQFSSTIPVIGYRICSEFGTDRSAGGRCSGCHPCRETSQSDWALAAARGIPAAAPHIGAGHARAAGLRSL